MAQFLLLFIEESERIFRNIIGRRGVMNNKVIPVIIFLIVILFSIFREGDSLIVIWSLAQVVPFVLFQAKSSKYH